MAQENLNIRIRAFDKTRTAFRAVNAGLGRIRKTVFSTQAAIGTLAGAAGFGLIVKSTIETNKQFQSLEATLKTFLGSSEKAAGAFEVLREFAAQTPFSVQEVTESFNTMIARGLNPTISALDAFGNIASGSGRSVLDFAQAAAQAATGEFETLKSFGIKASKEGERITFIFKGIETEVKNNAEEIQGFLENLGRTEFAGATAEQAKTLSGAFSNLGDSVEAFQKQIGEGGLNDALVQVSKEFSRAIGNSNELANTIGKILGGAILGTFNKLRLLLNASYAFGQAVAELQNGQIALNQILQRTTEISDQLAEKQLAARTATDETTASTQKLDEKLKEATGDLTIVSEKLSEGQQALKDYGKTARDVQANLEGAALRGVKSLEDSLVGIVTGATSAKDAFRSMAQSIIADLARMAIQKAITAPLAGALGGLFGGSTGATSTAAIGGSQQRGRPVLVGERGAELFVPSSSGSIISNKNLAGAGGVTVNQTINVTTGVQQTVRSEIVNLMPQIANATKAAVADSRLRGGSFSKAFGG